MVRAFPTLTYRLVEAGSLLVVTTTNGVRIAAVVGITATGDIAFGIEGVGDARDTEDVEGVGSHTVGRANAVGDAVVLGSFRFCFSLPLKPPRILRNINSSTGCAL